MLEDVLGWVVVLVGAVIMRFTDLYIIDPVISLGVALFILINAVKNLKEVADLFLEKTPKGISVDDIRRHLTEIDGVQDVHHIHIRSIDGHRLYATMHIVAEGDVHHIKDKVREELSGHGIAHSVIETEAPGEHCHSETCVINGDVRSHRHHHHHHHHNH
jgi:cobalt-zinc-cadmium efflux system protein